MTGAEESKRAVRVLNAIEPLLAGHGPIVQGAVLAHLTAQWVCGHHPASCREDIMQAHFAAVRLMVEDISKTR